MRASLCGVSRCLVIGPGRAAIAGSRNIAAAGDGRIGHDAEKLRHGVEGRLLHAGCDLTRELRQRGRQVATAQAEHGEEVRRERAATGEEVVQRAGDVLLVGAEPARCAERGDQIELYAGAGVAETGREARPSDRLV